MSNNRPSEVKDDAKQLSPVKTFVKIMPASKLTVLSKAARLAVMKEALRKRERQRGK